MKGIILAGGSGTRLHPITKGVSKQLIPVYDKPMIYYPLSVLMMAGICEILVITTPEDNPAFTRLLGDGHLWGLRISYTVQPSPDGLAQAFILGREFIGSDDVCLVLGDNIFYGNDFTTLLKDARNTVEKKHMAAVFGYHVNDPKRYGVAEIDNTGHVISIEEKPENPKSNWAVTGLYFYPNDVVDIVREVTPSQRGELEITSLNNLYLDQSRLDMFTMNRGYTWLDTGTFDSLSEASIFIETVEKRQGLKICCPEEIAFLSGWITADELMKLGKDMAKNPYGQYLMELAGQQ